MTAVVSRERARATFLTGAAGALLLVVAFMMMVVAAPAHAHGQLHGAGRPAAAAETATMSHHCCRSGNAATSMP